MQRTLQCTIQSTIIHPLSGEEGRQTASLHKGPAELLRGLVMCDTQTRSGTERGASQRGPARFGAVQRGSARSAALRRATYSAGLQAGADRRLILMHDDRGRAMLRDAHNAHISDTGV